MKVLYITHLSGLRVNRFWLSAIQAVHVIGGTFHIACNMKGADKKKWEYDCEKYNIISHQIDFSRSPYAIKNFYAYKQLKKLMQKEKFDIVHCNTPVAGVIGRLAAFNTGAPKIIYQAHGFHFFKGAPLVNWLFFYPVERLMARITDVLLTINEEDTLIASNFKLHNNGYIRKVHGVGIIIPSLDKKGIIREQIREELGISKNIWVFIAVGELIKRKNQSNIIDAFIKANIPDSCLLICGEGPLRKKLQKKINDYKADNIIRLLGYREDVLSIMQAADVFVISSFQEGLSVALMEAMGTGLPCIASNIRGNRDLLGGHSSLLFDHRNIDALSKAMVLALSKRDVEGTMNRNAVKRYVVDTVVKELIDVYA